VSADPYGGKSKTAQLARAPRPTSAIVVVVGYLSRIRHPPRRSVGHLRDLGVVVEEESRIRFE